MDVALALLFLAGLIAVGALVGTVVRSPWVLLFPPLLTVLWLAGNTLFAEPDPGITAREAVLSALVMVMLPLATGALVARLVDRKRRV